MKGAACLSDLAATLHALRSTVALAADSVMTCWAPLIERSEFTASAHNLAAYLALRRQDLRPLQVELMGLGLSSLGRLEGRVLANLDAVAWALDHLPGLGGRPRVPPERFWQGQATLGRNTDRVFGPRSAPRRVRYKPGDGFAAACQVPAVLDQLAPGQRVFIDDGKVGTVSMASWPRGRCSG